MRRSQCKLLLGSLVLLLMVGFSVWGPIAQWPDYHAFADQRGWLGVPRAADVLSNLLFLLPGLLGIGLLARSRSKIPGQLGYGLFFLALTLTAAGSAWYHWAPDNARLVWDRLPIALACAGILDAVLAQQCGAPDARCLRPLLWTGAPLSVAWWVWTADLRPYLFLQALPLLLIPALLWLLPAPRCRRWGLGLAVGAYLLAKLAECADGALLAWSGWLSGHTLKHVLAALAGLAVVWAVRQEQTKTPPAGGVV